MLIRFSFYFQQSSFYFLFFFLSRDIDFSSFSTIFSIEFWNCSDNMACFYFGIVPTIWPVFISHFIIDIAYKQVTGICNLLLSHIFLFFPCRLPTQYMSTTPFTQQFRQIIAGIPPNIRENKMVIYQWYYSYVAFILARLSETFEQ